MASLSCTAGETSVTGYLSGLANPASEYLYEFVLSLNGTQIKKSGGLTGSGSGTSLSYTFTGLSSGVAYQVDVWVVWIPQSPTEYHFGPVTGTTIVPIVSTLTLVSRTTTSLTFRGYYYSPVYVASFCNFSVNSSAVGSAINYGSSPWTTGDVTVTGLSPGTSYSVLALFTNTLGGLSSASQYFSTEAAPPPTRPSNWAWTSTVAQGAAFAITAVEWNNFVARINAFRTYKSMSAASFTTAIKGYAMTPAIANEARTAINAMSPSTAVPAASVAGTVYASFFNGLKNSLNSIA